MVVVGIENYLLVPRVPGAARNATDWYTFFSDALKVPFERIHLLRDKSATREGILSAVNQAASEVEPGGTLWFVFVGHGAPSRDGKEGLLVGADAQQTAEGLFARSVAQSEVLAALGKPAGVHAVAVIDACFSGRTSTGDALAQGLQPLVLLRKPAETGPVVVMTAGAPDQFAGPLPDIERPAFSYLVLGALRGWGDADGDGVVTAREAVGYAHKTLNVLPIGRSQTPTVSGGDVTLALTHQATERGPKLSDLLPAPEERGPVTKPVAPEGPDVRKFALASEAPPPEAVLMAFEPEKAGEHWVLLADGKTPVCELPCRRWVTPNSGLVVQRDADRTEDIRRVTVPAELGYSPGRSVRAVPLAERGGDTSVAGWTLGGLGAFLLGAGIVGATLDTSSTSKTMGMLFDAMGGVCLAIGVPLIIYSAWSRPSSLELTLDTRTTGVAARLGAEGLQITARSSAFGVSLVATPFGAFGSFD